MWAKWGRHFVPAGGRAIEYDDDGRGRSRRNGQREGDRASGRRLLHQPRVSDQAEEVDLGLGLAPGEMPKISKKSKAEGNGHAPVVFQGEVCLLKESPFRILKVAANGKLEEFERLYKEDNARMEKEDSKGQRPLHHAAKNGQGHIVKYIITAKAEKRIVTCNEDGKKEGEKKGFFSRFSKASVDTDKDTIVSHLDVVDHDGNTALHLAAENNQPQIIRLLLDAGACSSILNVSGWAPIHTATCNERLDALLALCRHPSVDVNLGGDKSVTAMHIAAYRDQEQAARILLENGSKLCKPCEVGMLPVHVATLHGSANTLEAIMQYAEKAGYTRDEILKLRDSSKNMPLHTAVSGGDIRAVQMCLKAGAQISGVQDDNSTAIHIAAQTGNLEMIQIMFEAQPENRDHCIYAKDVVDMTPLHKAAVFDRAPVAKFLIEQGAPLNDLDSDGMSPLLLAAAKKAWNTVEVLLTQKADVAIRDKKNRNILHLIIMNGGKPEQFSFCMCSKKVGQLTNEADEVGCTPLHYASRQGLLKTVLSLIKLGALSNAKNNNRESPLHFAAGHGRINTCKRLLESQTGKNTINETNGDGLTALHSAAQCGHTPVVLLLLERGSCVLKDRFGNTAMHLAAAEGFVNTVQAILNVHGYLLNAVNKVGDTALHLASREGHTAVVTLLMSQGAAFEKNYSDLHFVDEAIKNEQMDVLAAVVSHDRYREALTYCSSLYGCPMIGLIKQAPEVCQMVLDKCRTSSKDDPSCEDFHYTFDFQFLDFTLETAQKLRKEKINYTPLYAMNIMVQYNRVSCLSHPVCLAFLKMKWRAYGMWFWATNLLIYVAFLASLTSFIANYHYTRNIDPTVSSINSTESNTGFADHWSIHRFSFSELPWSHRFTAIVILVFSILNMIKEVVQLVQQRGKYFADLNNYLEWVLYITSTIFIGPFLTGISSSGQWQCGAIAVFLAWFNLLLFLQRFDLYGIYVVMFLEILRTLVQVLCVFSILIIAFGMAFYTLMYTDPSDINYPVAGRLNRINTLHTDTNTFASPQMSLMTVILMMLSSIEYIDSWVNPYSDDDPNTLHFATLSFLMLAVFILLMPILLMNLLIGLAVGDIEAVQKDATLKRLAMQVELHTDLERKLPARLLKYVHKTEWILYPNCAHYFIVKFFRNLTSTNDEDYSPKDDATGQDTFVYQELYNQKQRLKKIQNRLDRQYDLLRLIVQKMEIRSEADDEEETDNQGCNDLREQKMGGAGWSNPNMRNRIMKQASVLAKWGKTVDQSHMD